MDRLPELFAYIDLKGARWTLAEAEIELGSGESLTVRAGGGLVTSQPTGPPFVDYEVMAEAEPPKYWTPYSDLDGLVYAHVPRLLVTHLITRRGGIIKMFCRAKDIPRAEVVPVAFPIVDSAQLMEVFEHVLGRMMPHVGQRT